jgi:hypothetical protein
MDQKYGRHHHELPEWFRFKPMKIWNGVIMSAHVLLISILHESIRSSNSTGGILLHGFAITYYAT